MYFHYSLPLSLIKSSVKSIQPQVKKHLYFEYNFQNIAIFRIRSISSFWTSTDETYGPYHMTFRLWTTLYCISYTVQVLQYTFTGFQSILRYLFKAQGEEKLKEVFDEYDTFEQGRVNCYELPNMLQGKSQFV